MHLSLCVQVFVLPKKAGKISVSNCHTNSGVSALHSSKFICCRIRGGTLEDHLKNTDLGFLAKAGFRWHQIFQLTEING